MAAPLILAALAGFGADRALEGRAKDKRQYERSQDVDNYLRTIGATPEVGPIDPGVMDMLTSESADIVTAGHQVAQSRTPAALLAVQQAAQDRDIMLRDKALAQAKATQEITKGGLDISQAEQNLAKGSVELANLVAESPRQVVDPYTIDSPAPLLTQVPGRGSASWREHNEQMLVYNDMLQAATQYQEMLETMGTEIFNPRNKSMLESARMQLQMLKRSAEKLGTWDEGTATLLNQWLDDPTSLWNNIISGTGLGAGAVWNSEYFKGQMDYIREVATRQAISHHRLMPNTDLNYNFVSERVIPVGPYRDLLKARLAETQRAAQ